MLFWKKLTVKLWRIALRFHSLNFKALDRLRIASFKRYFRYFVDRLQLFHLLATSSSKRALLLLGLRLLCLAWRLLELAHHFMSEFSAHVRLQRFAFCIQIMYHVRCTRTTTTSQLDFQADKRIKIIMKQNRLFLPGPI